MTSKPLVFVLLAAGSVAAAAGGGYLAVRQNAVERPVAATAPGPEVPAASQPVTETEALVESPAAQPETEIDMPPAEPARPGTSRAEAQARSAAPPRPAPRSTAPNRNRAGSGPDLSPERPAEAPEVASPAPLPNARVSATPEVADWDNSRIPELPPVPPPPVFVEVVIPASSVLGLQVETTLSSERARVEDRVEARVTRDVMADGRLAIPSGSRVLGSVTLVEQGGKMKERARLGVRFHTLVLADGTQLPLRTDPIFREGESPSTESARKIGGAAVGGAILGAIIGGGKGAAIGGATGAAGGTAVVMAGDRNPATLPAGTVVTVRLTAPVSIEVEKR